MAVNVANKESLTERIVKAKEQIEQKNGMSLADLYAEKEQRIADAAQLKIPDRVPVTIQTTVFAARYAGVPLSAMYYDANSYRRASLLASLEFDADTGGVGLFSNSGTIMEMFDTKNAAWPGGTSAPAAAYSWTAS